MKREANAVKTKFAMILNSASRGRPTVQVAPAPSQPAGALKNGGPSDLHEPGVQRLNLSYGGGEVVPHGPDDPRAAALATKWDDAQAAALAATLNSLHCDSVTSLKLHDNGKLTERGIEALLSTGAFDQLTVLDCRFTAITSLSSCTSLRRLARLRELHLGGCENLERLELPKGASLSDTFPELEVLGLSGTGVTELPDGLDALPRLRLLGLQSCAGLKSPVQGQPWTRNEVKAVLYALEAKAVVVGWPTERMEDDAGPYPRNRFDIGEGEGVSCCFIDCC